MRRTPGYAPVATVGVGTIVMPSRIAFLCVLQLILGTSAFAQNASSAASKDCQSSDTNRRLSGCTEVINARGFGSQSNLADALDGRCWA